MFDKISRSWHLVKASAGVLRSDKELLLFPVISGIATLLVAATFLVPVLGLRLFEGGEIGPLGAIVGFLFYLSQYFVIFFFNTALVGAAMIRLEGGDPTVADGLRIARSKIGVILGYAAIAATVGLVLKSLGEKAGGLGKIIINMIGMAWTFATFLVVPILVTRDVGPIDAVKESMTLLKRTWGENVAGNVGIGLAFGLLTGLVALGVLIIAGNAADPMMAAHAWIFFLLTVAGLIEQLGYAGKRIAVEHNGEIVPKSRHASTPCWMRPRSC